METGPNESLPFWGFAASLLCLNWTWLADVCGIDVQVVEHHNPKLSTA